MCANCDPKTGPAFATAKGDSLDKDSHMIECLDKCESGPKNTTSDSNVSTDAPISESA